MILWLFVKVSKGALGVKLYGENNKRESEIIM